MAVLLQRFLVATDLHGQTSSYPARQVVGLQEPGASWASSAGGRDRRRSRNSSLMEGKTSYFVEFVPATSVVVVGAATACYTVCDAAVPGGRRGDGRHRPRRLRALTAIGKKRNVKPADPVACRPHPHPRPHYQRQRYWQLPRPMMGQACRRQPVGCPVAWTSSAAATMVFLRLSRSPRHPGGQSESRVKRREERWQPGACPLRCHRHPCTE